MSKAALLCVVGAIYVMCLGFIGWLVWRVSRDLRWWWRSLAPEERVRALLARVAGVAVVAAALFAFAWIVAALHEAGFSELGMALLGVAVVVGLSILAALVIFVWVTRGLPLVLAVLTWGAFALGWAPAGWVLVIADGIFAGWIVIVIAAAALEDGVRA